MKTLVVIALLFMGLGSSSAQAQWGALIRTTTSGPPVEKSDMATGAHLVEEYPTPATDEKVFNQLKSLMTEAGWYSAVKLRVKDGIVTIEGTTASRDHLRVLIEAAQRLPHTVAVVNKVDVQTPIVDNIEPLIDKMREFAARVWQLLPTMVIALILLGILLFIGRFVNEGVRAVWRTRIANPFLSALVARLTLAAIWVLILSFSLRLLGIPNIGATIIGGTGFLTLFLVLAFKGIAENYLAGILLASRSPFTKGDLIQIGNYQGYVQNLNMRGTTIIDLNGNLILVPNIMIISSVVENRTANPSMRTSFVVNIGYQDSITQAKDLILKALSTVEGVLKDPGPGVVVENLNTSAVQLRVLVWFDVRLHPEGRMKSRCMIAAKETLLANGINIPVEAREVVITEPLKIEMTRPLKHQAAPDKKAAMRQKAENNLRESRWDPNTSESLKEKLMDLAEKNPLPGNPASPDLLDNRPQEPKTSKS